MGFSETCADLICYLAGFGLGQRSALKTVRKGFAIKELHRKKIDFALPADSSVNIENLTNIGVADLARMPYFRRQPLSESCLSTLERDAALNLLVLSFINDAHTALRQFASDAKAVLQQIAWLKRTLENRPRDKRLQEKTVHPLFPFNVVLYLDEQLRVAGAGALDVVCAFSTGAVKRQFHQIDYEIIVLRFTYHVSSPFFRITRRG